MRLHLICAYLLSVIVTGCSGNVLVVADDATQIAEATMDSTTATDSDANSETSDAGLTDLGADSSDGTTSNDGAPLCEANAIPGHACAAGDTCTYFGGVYGSSLYVCSCGDAGTWWCGVWE
jgi:hypothetical protein